jgi:WD40 repeat protein
MAPRANKACYHAVIAVVTLTGASVQLSAQPLAAISLENSPTITNCVQFSPDGKFVVGQSKVQNNSFDLWSSETGKIVQRFQGHNAPVNCIAFSADGKKVISGSADTTLKIWSVENGQLLRTLSGHTGPLSFVAVSSDGKLIASTSADKTVRIWDFSGDPLRKLEDPHGVMTVAFSPDSQTVAAGGVDGNVKLWELSSGKLLRTLQDPQIRLGLIVSIAYSANNALIAAAVNNMDPMNPNPTNTVQVWEVNSSRLIQKLSAPVVGFDSLASLVFAPDSSWIAAASIDALATPPKITGRVWALNSGKLLCSLNGIYVAATSVDARRIVTGSISGLSIRNGRESAQPNECPGLSAQ